MSRFIITRALTLTVGLLLASIIIFATLRLLPGDVAQVIGGTQTSPERIAEIRDALGLDTPVLAQYVNWITGVFSGNLGNSLMTGTPIHSEILAKSSVTIPLAVYSLVIGLAIALPLGIWTAYRLRSPISRVISFFSVVAAAVPVVWAGLLGILVAATWFRILPSQGFPLAGWSEPLQAIRSLTLPALTISLIEAAILFRFVKSATLAALDAPHVRTGMSHGLTRFQSLMRHGLPGVGLSIISILGLQVAALLAGAVVVEQLFSLPGLGRMLVTDVGNRDLVKVQSTVFVLTAVILVLGALVDVAHRMIDPRMKDSR